MILLLFPARAGDLDRAAFLKAFADKVRRSGLGFEVVDVIPDLPVRYGTFADLDGDGDLDYIATEMSHRRENVLVFRRDGGTWRRISTASSLIRGRHPLTPWVLPDAGDGRPGVLVPVGWAPYLVLYPTDGAGRLRERAALSLKKHLPRRRSKPGGVDNNPYHVTRVGSGFVEGEMRDGRVRRLFRIDLTQRRRKLVAKGSSTAARIDDNGRFRPKLLPASYHETERERIVGRALGSRPANDPKHPYHDGVLSRLLLGDDLVILTTDFAAHEFPGTRGADGRLDFGRERADPRCMKLAWARALWPADPESVRDSPGYWAEFTRSRIWTHDSSATVPLSIVSGFNSYHVLYQRDGENLVPSFVHRKHFDLPIPPGQKRVVLPWVHRDEAHLCRDATGDGVPETISVELIADRRGGPSYSHVFGWPGVVPERRNGIIRNVKPKLHVKFPEVVDYPRDRHLGLPMELEEIPVTGSKEKRWCIYYRPWQVGIFLRAKPRR